MNRVLIRLISTTLLIGSVNAVAKESTLMCPDGRTITTVDKDSKAQRAKTANQVITETAASFAQLPAWHTYAQPSSLKQAIDHNCKTTKLPDGWKQVCQDVKHLTDEQVYPYIERQFTPYQLAVNGSSEGKLTGYYASGVQVSRIKDEQYKYPIYKMSKKAARLSRSEINNQALPDSEVLFWADNHLDTYILAVQGSGFGVLPNGDKVGIVYGGKNSHGYVSIGKTLLECGSVKDKMSLEVIQQWVANASDQEYMNLINNNQSYVFFREVPYSDNFVAGALGVPLTPMRSLAVDARYIKLGSMMYLSVENPLNDIKIERAFIAQDRGGAINGGLRGDIFTGEGQQAEKLAGELVNRGTFWILKPNR